MTESTCSSDCIGVLKSEFFAEDGSFLLRLRVNLEWNRKAFSRLVTAMKAYCEGYAQSECVERWLAGGFWYLQLTTKEWTTHPNFPRPHPSAYYETAYRLIDDLAYWFFMGEHGYKDKKSIDELVDQVREE
jgi:hypothetical protein